MLKEKINKTITNYISITTILVKLFKILKPKLDLEAHILNVVADFCMLDQLFIKSVW